MRSHDAIVTWLYDNAGLVLATHATALGVAQPFVGIAPDGAPPPPAVARRITRRELEHLISPSTGRPWLLGSIDLLVTVAVQSAEWNAAAERWDTSDATQRFAFEAKSPGWGLSETLMQVKKHRLFSKLDGYAVVSADATHARRLRREGFAFIVPPPLVVDFSAVSPRMMIAKPAPMAGTA